MKLKYILYVVFATFLFSLFSINVHADVSWPNVSYEIFNDKYKKMEYCVYNVKNVYEQYHGRYNNTLYGGNKNYIFIYDAAADDVLFLTVNGNGVNIEDGDYKWNSSEMKVHFGITYNGKRESLSDYLVDNGSLNCKPLYFVQTYSNLCIDYDFYTYSDMPNSKMLCDSDFSFDASEIGYGKGFNTLIKNSYVTGTHYDGSISPVCAEKIDELNEIYDYYRTEFKNPFNNLASLAYSEYQDGYLVQSEQYVKELSSVINNTFSKLKTLGVVNWYMASKDSDEMIINYNVYNCEELKDILNSLIGAMRSANGFATTYSNNIILNAAKSGVTLSEQEAAARDRLTNLNKEKDDDFKNFKDAWDEEDKKFEDQKNDNNIGEIEKSCDGIIGQEMMDFINEIFRWIQIIAPIIVIVMGGVEFAGAALQDDKDALRKAANKFIKRLIIAVALFFIPIILNFLLEIFNDISGSNVSTCGIGE